MSVKTKINTKRRELKKDGVIRKRTMVEKYGIKLVAGLVFLGIVIGATYVNPCIELIKYFSATKTVLIINPANAQIEKSSELVVSAEGNQVVKENIRESLPPVGQTPDDIQKIIEVARAENFDWKMLVAITEQESSRCKNLTGDHGLSKGCFHIYHLNTCEYRETATCISDLDRLDVEKATKWTIARLRAHEKLGYKEMIRSHNGLIASHANDWYPENIINIMKNL